MRVLFTTLSIASTGGVEMYLLDLSRELLRRGWQPCVYAPTIGSLAERFRQATVPVCDDLRQMQVEPDIIHGNYGLATFAAACRFPSVPIVSMCHAWHWDIDRPPLLPRIHRYLAVDYTCRERLLCRLGVPPDRVSVLHNAVDLSRFKPRPPLPAQPKRALVINNYLRPTQLRIIEAACRQRGISLDGAGRRLGNVHPTPETLLPEYDVVFGKGRCAWEALATGCAVVICGAEGLGPMVRSTNLVECRRLNFGCRLLTTPLTTDDVLHRLDEYNPLDAADLCETIRSVNSLARLADELTALYQEVIATHAAKDRCHERDTQAIADYAQLLCREYSEALQSPRAKHTWRERAKKFIRSVTQRLPGQNDTLRKAA